MEKKTYKDAKISLDGGKTWYLLPGYEQAPEVEEFEDLGSGTFCIDGVYRIRTEL